MAVLDEESLEQAMIDIEKLVSEDFKKDLNHKMFWWHEDCYKKYWNIKD